MKKNYIARRRGTSLAAAALSFALVAPFAQPVAFAAPKETAEVSGEVPSGTSNPLMSDGVELIEADAIAVKYIKNATGLTNAARTLSGRALEITRDGRPATSSPGLSAVPEGTKVYMQWIDADGAVSPIYVTRTHDNLPGDQAQGGYGTYAFDLREPWYDANGKEHYFHAPGGKFTQRYRLWVDPYERDGVEFSPVRQVGGFFPGKFTPTHGRLADGSLAPTNGDFAFENFNMQRTGVFMSAQPKDLTTAFTKPEADWQDATVVRDSAGNPQGLATQGFNPATTLQYRDTISGRAWIESSAGEGANSFNGAHLDTRAGDIPAVGYKVVLSQLSPTGYQQYQNAVDGVPEENRNEAALDFMRNNSDAIGATYYTVTDEKGNYSLQLPTGHTADTVGKLDNIWMTILDPQGNEVAKYSPWMLPQFHNAGTLENFVPRSGTNENDLHGELGPLANPSPQNHYRYNFAVVPQYSVELFDIVNYNVTDMPAIKDVDTAPAILQVKGDTPVLPTYVEWYSGDRLLKGGPSDCLITTPTLTTKALGACAELDFNDDAYGLKPGDVVRAVLVTGTADGRNEIASDSFAIRDKQNPELQAETNQPEYKETDAPKGRDTRVEAPKNVNGQDLPDGTKFYAPSDPNVRVLDKDGNQVEFPGTVVVNPDGSLIVTPNADAPVDAEYKIPVVVRYPDGKAVGSAETIFAPVKIVEPKAGQIADGLTPAWDNKVTPAGTAVVSENVGEDISKKVSKIEAVSDQLWSDARDPEKNRWKVEVGDPKADDSKAPITVTPPTSAQTGDKSTIWVTVTYEDGSQDVETFTVTVQNDDNNDSDPKNDGNVAEQTTPVWANAETRPGKPVEVPNTGDSLPDGAEVTAPADIDGWKVTVDGDKVTVTAPEGAKDGDKVRVPVTVKYPEADGPNGEKNFSYDTEWFTVTVVGEYEIEYTETKVKVDEKKTAKPQNKVYEQEDQKKDPYPVDTTTFTQGAKDDKGLWTIEDVATATDAQTEKVAGDIEAVVTSEKLQALYVDEQKKAIGDKCEAGSEITDADVKKLIDALAPKLKASSTVSADFVVSEQKDVVANFTLVGADDKEFTADSDFDGDGVSNAEEIKNCTNPFDAEDANKYTPTYPDTTLAPKEDGTWEPITVKPTYTDGKTPQDEKYAVDPKFKAPEGYTVTIDEKTGEITVVVDPSKLNKDTEEDFTVPVVVTYQDGTQDEVTAKFELDSDGDGTPDSKDDDDDNDGIKDTDEKNAGTNPKDPNSAPTTITPIGNQTGTVGKPITPVEVEVKDIPAGGKIEVSGLPEDVNYDPTTGKITGTPTKEEKSTVTVTVVGKDGKPVTGADGKPVEQTFTFTVNPAPAPTPTPTPTPAPSSTAPAPAPSSTAQPPAPSSTTTTPAPSSTTTTPAPSSTSATPAPSSTAQPPTPSSTAPAPAPSSTSTPPAPSSTSTTPQTPAKDPKVVPGENTEVPNTNEPTTVGTVENPRGDEQGKLVDKDGEEIPGSKVEIDPKTGEIKVTVPKGTDPQDATVVITGKDKDGKDQEIGKIDVKITGPTVKGEDSNVPNDNKPHTVGEVENPRGDEQGKLIGKDGEEIPGSKVEITPEGEIKVTVPENTKPQEGKVVVTDNEGNKIGEVPANVIDKDSDAAKYEPKYGDPKDIKVGETEETVNPFGDVKDVPVKEVNVTVPGTATNWTVEVVTEPSASGVLKVTAPTTEQVAEEFKKFFPENPKTWAEVVEKLTPFAKPEIDVEFVYNDGSKDDAKAGFNLVDKDGKSILDPTGDIDGDGKTNEQEIKEGTDPTKIESGQNQNDTTAPTVNPVKDTDKEISGKGDRPGEKIVVTFPDGKTVETTTDKNGEWTVKVPEGTKLETGKTITVTDGDGNKTDTTVTDGTAPKVNPVKDTDKQITGEGRPGETLTVTFPDGKKVTVKVGDDGKWSVKVPEGTKLETGKKITVEDQDGNKTEVTIESGQTADQTTGLTEEERNRCIATSIGFGLPLLALIPLGLATQIAIPGLTPVVEQVSAQIQAANSRIQQQFGIFNPQMAAQVAQVDAQLRQFGLDVATVGAGVVLLAAGILAGTIIYDNCTPGGGSSNATLKDAELKGSSGRTYLKVDKEEKEMKK